MSTPRALPGGRLPQTEKDLARAIRDLAAMFGWQRYHTHRSDYSPAGFPDETLCRPPRVVFAELKSEVAWKRPDHGCSPEQLRWLELLRQCPGVEVHLWRPSDLDDIVRTLR
jgi:hypothetical protein